MAKGQGTCSGRVSMVLDSNERTSSLTDYMNKTDEQELINNLSQVSSFPEYATIIFRLAQLRDQHAVSGILNSQDYKRALAAYELTQARKADAEKALEKAIAGNSWTPTAADRERIQRRVLGDDWKAEIAENLLNNDPSWLELQSRIEAMQNNIKKKTSRPDKSLDEVKKQLRVAVIKQGPLSAEVRKLKAIKNELESNTSLNTTEQAAILHDLQEEAKSLKQKLIGQEIHDKQGRYYKGGSLKKEIKNSIEYFQEERESDIETALEEEVLQRSHSGGLSERAILARAEKELEEGHHALQVHKAALIKAEKLAKAAKNRPFKLERQRLDENFIESLDKQPDQLRALFLENSRLKDHVVYLSYNPKSKEYELVAEIAGQENERSFIKSLKAQGGKDRRYNLDLPGYSSWSDKDLGSIKAIANKNKNVSWSYTPKESSTPASEQGAIRMQGKDPGKLVKELQKLDIHQGICEEVPFDIIYRGEYKYGRITPLYEPLASGRAALDIPSGNMVLHGLTGGASIGHFEKIVKTGGLKSIADRRRMRMPHMTLSPKGDIASGIDMGVPCKIGRETNFGSGIYFGMKPEILNRRDLWFSDRDFGGGHNRSGQYQAYAKKLGQGSTHSPCPVKGRQQHLDSGIGKRDNEAYFTGEISWNDVDTLFCTKALGPTVKEKVEEFKSKGILPDHIRVEIEGEAPAGVKAATIDQKKTSDNTTTRSSGWTQTKAGEIVFIEDIQLEDTKAPTWNINQLIQRRSREIAASVE